LHFVKIVTGTPFSAFRKIARSIASEGDSDSDATKKLAVSHLIDFAKNPLELCIKTLL